MSIDYFSLPGEPKNNKNDWFASVTCFSGCLNGSLGIYRHVNPKNGFIDVEKGRILETWPRYISTHGFNYIAAVLNFFTFAGTLDIEQECVSKVFK